MIINNISYKRKITYFAISLLCTIAFLFSFIKEKGTKTYLFNLESNDYIFNIDDAICQYKSSNLDLPKGNYIFVFDIDWNEDISVMLSLDNDVYVTKDFSASEVSEGNISIDVRLEEPTDQAYFIISSSNDFEIKNVGIISDRFIYDDYFYYSFSFILSVCLIVFLLIRYPYIEYKKQWIVIGFLIVLVCSPIFLTKNVSLLDDTRAHMLRIEGIYKGFLDGQLHVLVYPNANNQYGQTGALYPALFLYFPAFLRLLNISMLAAFKSFEIIIHISTILISYLCWKKIFKNENAVLIATVLYTLDFHRIGVSYNGGGLLGNGLAMIFFPVVLLGIFSIFYEDKKYWWTLPLGLALVSYSHVLSFVMMCLLIFIFTLFNIKKLFNKEMIICLVKSAFLFFLLAAGNIYAFLKFYLLGTEKSILVFINWMDTVINVNLIKELGESTYINDVIIMIILIICIFIETFILKNKNVFDAFTIHSLIIASFFMIFMSDITPWEYLLEIPFIHKITDTLQYSARFFYITQILFVIIITEIISNVRINKRVRYLLTFSVCCLTLFHFGAKSMDSVYGNSLLLDPVVGDYNSWRNNDYLLKDTKDEWFLSSVGNVSDESKITSYEYKKVRGHVEYKYSTKNENQYAEFPLIYYPGYGATNDIGEILTVSKGDRNRVRVHLPATSEPRTIYIEYETPVTFYIFDLISLFSFFWLFMYVYRRKEVR